MRRKKKKINLKKISLLLLVIVAIVAAIIYEKKYFHHPKEEENIIEEETSPKEKVYTTNLIMVGDVLVNDYVYGDAHRRGNYQTYDFKPQISLIKEITSNYDIAYYNQETIIGGKSLGLSSYPSFNSPEEIGDAMIDAGFNLVSLATNHTLDRGEQAILNSRAYWNKQEDVQAVGSYSSSDEKKNIESKVLESNGITYAMLNYTYGTNGINRPYGKDYLVNIWSRYSWESYKSTIESDINNLRDKVDVLIIAMHWGDEYTLTPISFVKEQAKYLSSLGVDIIIGTHPHVIEPVEWVGDTLVFYSLGNFLSAQTSDICSDYRCNIGLMSSLEITKTITDEETTISIENIQNELTYAYNKNYQDIQVIPFSNQKIKDYLPNYKNIYEKYAKIINTTDERINTIDCFKENYES